MLPSQPPQASTAIQPSVTAVKAFAIGRLAPPPRVGAALWLRRRVLQEGVAGDHKLRAATGGSPGGRPLLCYGSLRCSFDFRRRFRRPMGHLKPIPGAFRLYVSVPTRVINAAACESAQCGLEQPAKEQT
jgi:hypothetical protein